MTSRRPTAHEPAAPGGISRGLRAAVFRLRLAWVVMAAAASASVLAPASQLAAQSTSTAGIRGRVVDGEGAPVAAAAVTLVDSRTGTAATTRSNVDGRYAIRGQRPGPTRQGDPNACTQETALPAASGHGRARPGGVQGSRRP